MPMAEDLSVFFSADGFGDAGLLDGVPVLGILERGYAEHLGMAAHDGRYTLAEADTATTTATSTLIVAGITYRVRGVRPDGTGVCTLALERQS